MAKPTRKGEQSLENLLKLAPSSEGTECASEDCNETDSQLDAVEEANSEVREGPAFTKAVRSEEKHKVGGRQVEIDVLQTQKCCKQDA
jgi:hypothetical protein